MSSSASASSSSQSLGALLTGARPSPAAEAARSRADALYAFQGATVQCVRGARRLGTVLPLSFSGIRSPPLRCSPAGPSHALPTGSTTASHGGLQTAQHQVLAASRRAPWTRGRRRGSCGARTRRRPRRGERRERASFEGWEKLPPRLSPACSFHPRAPFTRVLLLKTRLSTCATKGGGVRGAPASARAARAGAGRGGGGGRLRAAGAVNQSG